MKDPVYRLLVIVAVVMGVGWVGWSFYDGFLAKREPGHQAFRSGERYFEDGRYEQALRAYNEALRINRDHAYAQRGRGRALLKLQRHEEAIQAFDHALERIPDNEAAALYANRGIAHDFLGDHRRAIADYRRALALNPEVAEGPNWLTRFLRLQPEKPPTIADRAAYLEAQLRKPEHERVLRIPEQDAAQRPYKM